MKGSIRSLELRGRIRESLASNGNDKTKAAYDAVRLANIIGASDGELAQAMRETGLTESENEPTIGS